MDVKGFRETGSLQLSQFACHIPEKGAAVAQRLRCRATYRKVAGSIPVGVVAIFPLT